MEVAKEIHDIMKNVDAKTGNLKLILWLGAGIDKEAPTNLPSGLELTEFLLENTYTGKIAKRKRSLTSIYGEPRLESVIECYRMLEENLINQTPSHPFLQGLSTFWDAEPNWYHFLFAEFLLKGANIVTTNYDRCIPLAYHRISKKDNDKLIYHQYGENRGYYYFFSEKNTEKIGKIYHIHGIAAEIDTIGATLGQLKSGLAPKFCEQMEKWLKEGYTFIFLGYSGGDSLDVNPFFKSMGAYKNATGIFVRHCCEKENRVEQERFTENESILLKGFQNKFVFECDTKEFLNNFGLDNRFDYSNETGNDWKLKFKSKSIGYDDDLKLLLTIQLCYNLGIKSNRILPKKWWKKLSEINTVNKWYINYHGFAVAKLSRNKKILKFFEPAENDSELFKSDYMAAFHKYKEAAKVFGSPLDILKKLREYIKRGIIIEWEVSTALNRWAEYLLIEITHRPYRILKNINKYSKEGEELIEAFELIIENQTNLRDISQYYTALRFHAIFKKIYDKDSQLAEEQLKTVIEEYKRISYISGVIGTMSLYVTYQSFEICLNGNYRAVKKAIMILIDMAKYIIKNYQFYYLYHILYNFLFFVYSFICSFPISYMNRKL